MSADCAVGPDDFAAAESPPSKFSVREFSRVNVWMSLATIVWLWGWVALASLVSAVVFPLGSGWLSVPTYLVAVVIIATRQHAMLVLTHDGIHYRLAAHRNINDWLARILLAFPAFISLAKWRLIHFHHHKYTYSKRDPDVAIFGRYPISRRKFGGLLVQDLLGLNVLRFLKYFNDVPGLTTEFNRRFLGEERLRTYRRVRDTHWFYLFWVTVLAIGIASGGSNFLFYLGLYWVVPYSTVHQCLLRIRGGIEHGNVPDRDNTYQRTRTYLVDPVTAFLLAPLNVNYHLEHHLYPSVPYFRLPRLHRELVRSEYVGRDPYIERVWVSLGRLATKT